MEAAGHHGIAEEVGERVLKPALELAGRWGKPKPDGSPRRMRVGAFYLGNWLTDVSQAVDPVAYAGAGDKARALIEEVSEGLERMMEDAPSWIREAIETPRGAQLLAETRERLEDARQLTMQAIEALVGKGRDGVLADAFEALFRFSGYIKFVLENDGSEGKMDKESYYFVFERRYTQYYPHEHLDRPEVDPGAPGPPNYVSTPGQGPRNGRNPPPGSSSERDLYGYLRDDLEIIAGMLSCLDGGHDPCRRSWAPATFQPGRPTFADEHLQEHRIGDDVPAWNLELARLGHALHAIEDFFAHSTFVDHANASLPAHYDRFDRLEDGERIARRLKPWRFGLNEAQMSRLDNDLHVVTGYFDLRDTLISLGHLLDKALDRPRHTAGQTADRVIAYDYLKLLSDTLAFVSSPRRVWEENDPERDGYLASKANKAVLWLRGQGGHSLLLLQRQEALLNQTLAIMLRHPLLQRIDARARQDFERSVLLLGQAIGVAGLTMTLYRAIQTVAEFFGAPLLFLRRFIRTTIIQQLVDHGEAYLKKFAYKWAGADRIGCHSLIAKDSDSEVLHRAAMDCAKAIHWYVCTTLVRHGRARITEVCRTGRGTSIENVLPLNEWVDWLELLETFLGHPFASLRVQRRDFHIPIHITHITARGPSTLSPDTLEALANRYNASRYQGPNAPARLTWQMIADVNFPTEGLAPDDPERMRRINNVLRSGGSGLPTWGGVNYAFRPGLKLVIPWQDLVVQVPVVDTTHRWWHRVIVHGHEGGRETLGHHPVLIPHKQLLARITRGEALRRMKEHEYRP